MNKYSLLLFDSLMIVFPSHQICKFHSLALNGLDLSTELIDNHSLLLKLLFCSCKCGRDEDIWIQLQGHVSVNFLMLIPWNITRTRHMLNILNANGCWVLHLLVKICFPHFVKKKGNYVMYRFLGENNVINYY